jgi:hypothetical protein
MRHVPEVRLVLALIAALSVAGCGSDESRARSVVKDYLAGIGESDGEKACSKLTGDAKRELVEKINATVPEFGVATCPDAIFTLGENLGADEAQTLKDAEVRVQLDGDRGTAEAVGGSGDVDLVKSDGEWLIAGGFDF